MFKKLFSELKIGDVFTLSNSDYSNGQFLNIKVMPSKVNGEENFGTFNVINLDNGQPRTFCDNEYVYLITK